MLCPADACLELGGNICRHILAAGVPARHGESEIAIAQKMWILIEQIDILLQQYIGSLDGCRLLPPEETVSRYSKEATRADARLSIWTARSASGRNAGAVVLRCSGLRLKSKTIRERPAPRFRRLQQDGFELFIARGILDRRVYLAEQRKFVEAALNLGQRRLAQRIAGMQCN